MKCIGKRVTLKNVLSHLKKILFQRLVFTWERQSIHAKWYMAFFHLLLSNEYIGHKSKHTNGTIDAGWVWVTEGLTILQCIDRPNGHSTTIQCEAMRTVAKRCKSMRMTEKVIYDDNKLALFAWNFDDFWVLWENKTNFFHSISNESDRFVVHIIWYFKTLLRRLQFDSRRIEWTKQRLTSKLMLILFLHWRTFRETLLWSEQMLRNV